MTTKRSLAAVAALTLALLAGCGSGSDGEGEEIASAGKDSTENSRTDRAESGAAGGSTGRSKGMSKEDQKLHLKFASCMREQGIDMPDPAGDGKPQRAIRIDDPEKMEAAMEECREFAPKMGRGELKVSEKDKEAMRKFAQCMRDEGLEVGDPDPETGMPPAEDMQQILGPEAESDPVVAKALEACEQYRPNQIAVTR